VAQGSSTDYFPRLTLGADFGSEATSFRPIGELDLATVGEFQTALLGFAEEGERIVALDLSALTFVDATGLAAIVALERQLRTQQRVLALRDPSPMMKWLLDATGLTWLLEVEALSQIEAVLPRGELKAGAGRLS
jgi:anti-anti-sigma factor